MMIFAAVSMLVLLTFCLFSIDVAYIQLVRTELRTATDAASNAGCEALARAQDRDEAIDAAIAVAALNTVGGQPLVLTAGDIELGTAEINPDTNLYEFLPEGSAAHSPFGLDQFVASTVGRSSFDVLLNPNAQFEGSQNTRAPFDMAFGKSGSGGKKKSGGSTGDGSTGGGTTGGGTTGGSGGTTVERLNSVRVTADRGDVRAMSGGLFSSGTFKPTQQAVSTNSVRDIALVLDRSGSMNELAGPGTTTKKIEALKNAVEAFLGIIEAAPTEIRCSLSSYDTSATKDKDMTADLNSIQTTVDTFSPGSRTNIGGGLQHGTDSLHYDNLSRPYSTKAILLMTDGKQNEGVHPDDVIPDCIDRHHAVYTVTLGDPNASGMADAIVLMQSIADQTGGKHFQVNSAAELTQAFEDIANAIAILLVQ